MPLSEGAELTGEHGAKYLAVSPLGQSNVWTAVETGNGSNDVVVVKEPDANDAALGFPSFQNEMVMHELLKDSSGVRQQRDRIPSITPGEPPMLVLEISATTLWSARAKRPFILSEIKKICKDALIGLQDVHAQGLVYADLKMQNVMLDGFDADKPTSPSSKSKLQATLGDLGIVMEPAKGTVQPVSYRAPEVYFKADISPSADIWGWGLIYCHLLEARQGFDRTGMYDTLGGTLKERENATSKAVANDFGLHSRVSYSGVPLPKNEADQGEGDQWGRLRQAGVEESEVDFLRWVLRSSPADRPSAAQILASGWLDKDDDEVAQGFVLPKHGTLSYDSKRSGGKETIAAQSASDQRTEDEAATAQVMPIATLATSPTAASPLAKFSSAEKVTTFSGEPGAGFFDGRPSPFASNGGNT